MNPSFPSEWYQSLFDRSADAILIMQDDRFVDCNEAAWRMLGAQNKAAVLQLEPWQISPAVQPDGLDSQEKQQQMLASANAAGTIRFEWLHQKLNGECFPVEVALTVLEQGNSTYLHTSWRDISERKRLEADLRHAQKMEAIGKLVGGVAHDFNNQLMPIIGYTEMLQAKLGEQPDLGRYVKRIHQAAVHSADLIRRLMSFGRRDSGNSESCDICQVTLHLSQMIDQLMGEDIRYRVRVWDSPLIVGLSSGDIEQILLNLIGNARDAIDRSGRIDVAISLHQEQVKLEVNDNGCGMEDAVREQVFEPFFTTKDIGKGTGLGLASVFNLVQQAGGTISVASAVGSGSTFQIRLPLAEARPIEASGNPSLQAASLGNGDAVLVVEDDEAAGVSVQNALSESGFTVTLVGSGSEGLRAMREQTFDIVVADVVLPDMSGPELMTSMLEQSIELPVILMSGYTDNRLAAYDVDVSTLDMLRKPFLPSQLIARINQTLVQRRVAAETPQQESR